MLKKLVVFTLMLLPLVLCVLLGTARGQETSKLGWHVSADNAYDRGEYKNACLLYQISTQKYREKIVQWQNDFAQERIWAERQRELYDMASESLDSIHAENVALRAQVKALQKGNVKGRVYQIALEVVADRTGVCGLLDLGSQNAREVV